MAGPTRGDQPPTPNFVPGPQPGALPAADARRSRVGADVFAPSPFAVANPTAPPPGVRSLPTIVELVHAFKRRWVLCLMVGGLIATSLAVGVWWVMPAGKHQARATVQIKTDMPGYVGRTTHMETEAFEKMCEAELAKLRTKQFLTKVASDPRVAKLPMIAGSDAKERVIEDSVGLKRDPSEIVKITMTGDDKEQLRVLLDVYSRLFVSEAQEQESAELVRDLNHIRKMLDDLNAAIKADEKKLGVGAERGAGIAIDRVMTERDLASVATRLRTLKDRHEVAKQELDRLKAEKADPKLIVVTAGEVAEAVDANPAVALRTAVYITAKEKLEAKRKIFNDGAAALKEFLEAEAQALADLNTARKEATEIESKRLRAAKETTIDKRLIDAGRVVADLDGQMQTADAERKKLETDLKGLARNGGELADVRDQLSPRVRDRENLESQERQIKLLLRADDNEKPSRFKLLEEAVVYENWNQRQKMAFASGAAAFGLFAVCLIVSYLEWRNRRVDGVDQVVTELGMRVIGTIPAFPSRAALRNGEAGANQNWRFILNESVNSTRTMLLHTAKTQHMQVILVTSAMQGEGKTSLSSQLATSMATAGLRTLVLDCDLRNPSIQKLFDVPVAPGCAEVLLQEVDISDVVQQTSVPNLWVIPAGQCNHRVIAALAQGHPLEALFNRLRGQFDIIIVDSCPILPVADTLLVAQHVDGVVFSILQDVSQLPKVQDASDRLLQLNIPLLGAVVNGIKPDIQAYGYNYVKQLPA